MPPILPKKKQQLLKFLSEYIAKHGFAPTLTEMAKAMKTHALSTVHEHLQYLEERGFIKRSSREERGLMLTKKAAVDTEPLYQAEQSVFVPVLGMIAAGSPIEAIESRDVTLPVPQELVRGKNAYILKVKGDSMIESLIADGDYVVVEKTDYARDGDTVVAMLDDGTATLKKFFKHKSYIRLQPANNKYKPILTSSVVIQGKVLGVIRKY